MGCFSNDVVGFVGRAPIVSGSKTLKFGFLRFDFEGRLRAALAHGATLLPIGYVESAEAMLMVFQIGHTRP